MKVLGYGLSSCCRCYHCFHGYVLLNEGVDEISDSKEDEQATSNDHGDAFKSRQIKLFSDVDIKKTCCEHSDEGPDGMD